jgi:hypothetical protein
MASYIYCSGLADNSCHLQFGLQFFLYICSMLSSAGIFCWCHGNCRLGQDHIRTKRNGMILLHGLADVLEIVLHFFYG